MSLVCSDGVSLLVLAALPLSCVSRGVLPIVEPVVVSSIMPLPLVEALPPSVQPLRRVMMIASAAVRVINFFMLLSVPPRKRLYIAGSSDAVGICSANASNATDNASKLRSLPA